MPRKFTCWKKVVQVVQVVFKIVCGCHSIYCICCFPLIIVVEVETVVAVGWKKKTRGRAVVGDPLAFLTVVMKNYYETIISFSS